VKQKNEKLSKVRCLENARTVVNTYKKP
jgi:hypothetical protein